MAKWEKAPIKVHNPADGKDYTYMAMEYFTTVHILRVIKGDVAPSRHTVLFYGIFDIHREWEFVGADAEWCQRYGRRG